MFKMSNEVRLLLAVLAVYRLALMLASEDGPFYVFKRARRAVGRFAAARTSIAWWDETRLSLAELANCPLCLGIWLAAGVLPLIVWPFKAGDWLLLWLGLAGGQTLLQRGRPWQPS